MTEHMPMMPKQPDLSEDDKRTLAFAQFVKERSYTAEQLRAAYYHVLAPEDYPAQDQGGELVQEMQRLVDTGFPLNRMASLIGLKEQYEDAVQAYVQYVDTMPVTEKEQSMLKSILRKKRTGTLTLVARGEDIVAAKIKIRREAVDEVTALELLELLKALMTRVHDTKQVEFRFEE